MAKFSYTGRQVDGELTRGVIDAADESTAAKMLASRSIVPIEILAGTRSSKGQESSQNVNFLTPGVKLDDLVIFARQMYSLTRAGIPILRSVAGLADTTTSLRMRIALQDVIEQLERGRNLSSAMNQHPKVFTQLFVSVVHVGENTGQLDLAFLQLAEYLEREQETRKQIKAATRYPMFVIFALIIALIVMNIWVIPIFASMFSRFDAELPLMTRILMGMSDFFLTKWPYMVGCLALAGFAVYRYLQTEKGRWNWDRTKLRLPIVGNIIERSLLGRFSRSFAMMLKAGVPLTTALNLVADAVSNAFMAEKVLDMRRSIERGENLTRVANASGLFTPLVMQMISVGEETGRVDELLAETASYYEREVDYDLKSLTSKIEPILIGIVAGMVLVLALGIFTPMWDMMGAIRGGN
ncbi:type II secretion system F family protein [Alteromonas sp. ASW11-36]|uniref:Type II secretion system F family protein n=1 Tax=Alteromonas arenosi TaxID=3055817 RepID=A0ABT7SUB8_9ALTE|nr:type II secretion system F family protein [Alteromonas sp. ASW11-36]MDM7859142.1 type II secretion system F family protein [Alteromonas sp. ASW11-36]